MDMEMVICRKSCRCLSLKEFLERSIRKVSDQAFSTREIGKKMFLHTAYTQHCIWNMDYVDQTYLLDRFDLVDLEKSFISLVCDMQVSKPFSKVKNL